jgi:hypothetical protein
MVPAYQYQALHDALGTVQVNAQALAAADLAIGTVTAVREHFSSWSIDNARRFAAEQLDDAALDLKRYRDPFAGMPAAPVNPSSWDDLSHSIGRAYNVLWSIQDVIGDEPEWKATIGWVAQTTLGTIQALPGVIRDAVHFTSELASDTVGGVAAGLLPLWPIVLVGGAVLVIGSIALAAGRKRGLLA